MSFPTSSPPSLASWQLSYNGYTFGDQCLYDPDVIDGITSQPIIRSGDVDRPRDHGQFVGQDLLGGRDIIMTGKMTTQAGSLQANLLALATAVAPGAGELPLWINLPPYGVIGALARCRDRTTPLDVGFTLGAGDVSLQFHATDPALYGPPQTSSVTLGAPLSGMSFPATFPLSFGTGGTVGGLITCTNAGNFDSRPQLTIYGPCTTPTVQNTTTGWSITVRNPSQTGLTVLSGESVTIDLSSHAVTYHPASGSPYLCRSWILPRSIWPSTLAGINGLAPGSNQIKFTSKDATTAAATLSVAWASAYIL